MHEKTHLHALKCLGGCVAGRVTLAHGRLQPHHHTLVTQHTACPSHHVHTASNAQHLCVTPQDTQGATQAQGAVDGLDAAP